MGQNGQSVGLFKIELQPAFTADNELRHCTLYMLDTFHESECTGSKSVDGIDMLLRGEDRLSFDKLVLEKDMYAMEHSLIYVIATSIERMIY